MNAETAPICPRCGQLDAVRKVSSIVKEGVSVGEYEAYYPGQIAGKPLNIPVRKQMVSTTELAQKLKPPVKPSYKGTFSTSEGEVQDTAGTRFTIMLWLGLAYLAKVIVGSQIHNETIAWIAGILVFVLLAYRQARIEGAHLKEVRQATPVWEKAMQRWGSAFYCYRCDGVFIPGENRFIPIEQMRSFLYE